MEPISPDRIEATLFDHGREVDDYFLVDGSPMFWAELGGAMYPWACLIEDGTLESACAEYLRQCGVTEYASLDDVPQPPADG